MREHQQQHLIGELMGVGGTGASCLDDLGCIPRLLLADTGGIFESL
jgi:hypothetical protein